jgi:hypothetical protein
MEENELQLVLKRTGVVVTKDYKQWDWYAVLKVIEGPLSSGGGNNLKEALKTKFVKRLLSFLRPEKKMFADLDWTMYVPYAFDAIIDLVLVCNGCGCDCLHCVSLDCRLWSLLSSANMIYVRCACALFTLLLSTSDGREYPHFVELVDEILGNVLAEIGKDPSPQAAGASTFFARPNRADSDIKDVDALAGAGAGTGVNPGTPSSSRKSILSMPFNNRKGNGTPPSVFFDECATDSLSSCSALLWGCVVWLR